jgi:hypothetical protein
MKMIFGRKFNEKTSFDLCGVDRGLLHPGVRSFAHVKWVFQPAPGFLKIGMWDIGCWLRDNVKEGNPMLTSRQHCIPDGVSQKQSSRWQMISWVPEEI